jgi:UDP-GlcNAc:undecaprenyl-phosphate GlcNAc-1-phosphate transferase
MAPVAALFITAVLLLGIYLARVPAYNGEDFRALQKSSYAPFLKDITFRWHALEMLLDVVLISVVYYLSYRLRFEDERLEVFIASFTRSLPIVLGCKLLALHVSGAYSGMWGTFSIRDLFAIVRGVFLGSVASILAAAYLYRFERFSRGVFVIDAALLTIALVAARGSFRMMGEAAMSRNTRGRRVLIYGAGSGGHLLVREMRANAEWAMNPVAFLDDDPAKYKRRLLGVPVKGSAENIEDIIDRYRVEEVVLSTANIDPERESYVRAVCDRLHIRVRRFRLELAE